MEKQITRIREKLAQLKKLDTDCAVFGAEQHQYKLNPVLKPQKVVTFETKHGAKLPLEYIAFLTQLGNGGAGPFYGLEKLEKSLFQDLDSPDKAFINNLALPFPHSSAWNPIDALEIINEKLEKAAADEDEDAEMELWDEKTDLLYPNENQNGFLNICNFGCGINLCLVVNGAEKGNIWTDNRAYDAGFYPTNEDEFGNNTRIPFLDWYENWLDTSIDTIQNPKEETA